MAILAEEMPLIERVYDVLHQERQPKSFYKLISEMDMARFQKTDHAEVVTRLYTNMNVDGRFLCIGDNHWGLKGWYPVDQQEEEVAVKIRPRSTKEDDDEDFDDLDSELEDYDEDYDDDDSNDKDSSNDDDDDSDD